MSARHLYTSYAGVVHTWEDDGDRKIIRSFQNTDPILEHNKAAANHNSGWTGDKTFRRAASIPAVVRLKWLLEEGWDCFSDDPGCQKKLFAKLDSSEYAHLRTAEWRLGVLRGIGA